MVKLKKVITRVFSALIKIFNGSVGYVHNGHRCVRCKYVLPVIALCIVFYIGMIFDVYQPSCSLEFSRKSWFQSENTTMDKRQEQYSKHRPLLLDPHQEFTKLFQYGQYQKLGDLVNTRYQILIHYNKDWVPPLDLTDCEYNNCAVTNNQKHFLTSDAVIFNVGDPVPKKRIRYRPQNQTWIFFSLEPPTEIIEQTHAKNIFNWSMTYRMDSDIPHPYGVLFTKSEPPARNFSSIFSQKKKFAAFISSRCTSHNERWRFVKYLQQFVPVDIYGRCGEKLPVGHHTDYSDQTSIGNLLKDYKFYLSFENSHCVDYVTEKVFMYYPMDVVLIVRGKVDNYARLFPKKLFINTGDFPSIKRLAEYLTMLNSTESEYVKYLQERSRYRVDYQRWGWKNSLCQVCRRLNKVDKYRRIYNDVRAWLNDGTCSPYKDLVKC